MECIMCAEKIYTGDKYYSCRNPYIEKLIARDYDENVFCSKKCFCEFLELTEDVNDEEEVYESEDHDCEYDPYRGE